VLASQAVTSARRRVSSAKHVGALLSPASSNDGTGDQ
jgi:hypothetical protein